MANKQPRWHVPAQEAATKYVTETYESYSSTLRIFDDQFAIETFHCYKGDDSFHLLQAQYAPGGKFFIFLMRPVGNNN
jgi:hypothetical protein